MLRRQSPGSDKRKVLTQRLPRAIPYGGLKVQEFKDRRSVVPVVGLAYHEWRTFTFWEFSNVETFDGVVETLTPRNKRCRIHLCSSQFQSFQPFNRFAPFTTGTDPFQTFQTFNRCAQFKMFKFRNQKSGNAKDLGCFPHHPRH